MFLDNVPYETCLILPDFVDLPSASATPEFSTLVARVKHDFKTSVSLAAVRFGSSAPNRPHEYGLKLLVSRAGLGSLPEVRRLLEQFFLREHSALFCHPKRARMLPDDVFPSEDGYQRREAADKRLRLASSSPDVKSLFQDTPYQYAKPEESRVHQRANNDNPMQHYWSPLAQPVNDGSSQSHRHPEDMLKRGSDSLLESKLRDKLSKPRSSQNRAQSLDLTSSLSKIAENAVPPDSPTHSANDDDTLLSPSALAVPSFPSVYGPPPGTTSAQEYMAWGIHTAESSLDDDQVEEVSRVMSSLGL